MDYFKILHLAKEPFSNSPEPEFFYHSPQHVECLQNLELAIRLRRGLNVVVGDVGTGKTTLCRQLISRFSDDENIQIHLILDPDFSNPVEFLTSVSRMLGLAGPQSNSEWQLKEDIKNYLFERGVNEENLTVLIIDEGQKIPDFCIETLREFLNYETNDCKLLQIVIFAQNEFNTILDDRENFADRINYFYELRPLDFKDTRLMIRHRMEKASDTGKNPVRFTFPALRAIYRATDGYPRKIVTLCHQIILAIIIQNKTRVGWSLVHSCVHRKVREKQARISWQAVTVLASLVLVLLLLLLGPGEIKQWIYSDIFNMATVSSSTMGEPEAHKTPVLQSKVDVLPTPAGGARENGTPGTMGTVSRKDGISEEYETANPVHTEDLLVKTVVVGSSDEDTDNTVDTAGQSVREAEKTIKDGDDEEYGSTMAATDSAAKWDAEKTPDTLESIECPVSLGALVIEEGWIISRMVASIRGFCTVAYLRQVRRANPHIRNLNHVEAGDSISFPAIPVSPVSNDRRFWIQVAQRHDLDEAHRSLHVFMVESVAVRMLPYWNSREGLAFAIILQDTYMDEASARKAMEALPPHVARDAKIVSRWGINTIFFASL